jgi:hypothetical protein
MRQLVTTWLCLHQFPGHMQGFSNVADLRKKGLYSGPKAVGPPPPPENDIFPLPRYSTLVFTLRASYTFTFIYSNSRMFHRHNFTCKFFLYLSSFFIFQILPFFLFLIFTPKCIVLMTYLGTDIIITHVTLTKHNGAFQEKPVQSSRKPIQYIVLILELRHCLL